MSENQPGVIERFEAWLTTPRFIALLALLILLNLFVYFWWFNRPVFAVGKNEVGAAVLKGLEAEKQQLRDMLLADCGSEGLRAYERGETGPLIRPNQETAPKNSAEPPSTKIPKPNELISMLNAATVRVLTPKGTGTGFFIDKNTIVTNRHVIEGAPENKLLVTSNTLGSKPFPAKLIAATKDSKFGHPDFALLSIENTSGATRSLAISEEPVILQSVLTVGYPGIGTESDANQITPNAFFNEGLVSALQPQANGMVLIVHGANMSRGNSGGPLVSRCGHVVGVNTFIRSDKENVDGRLLYALSPSSLKKFIEQSGLTYQSASAECTSDQAPKAE
jgi:S1-C subfamily serine protease